MSYRFFWLLGAWVFLSNPLGAQNLPERNFEPGPPPLLENVYTPSPVAPISSNPSLAWNPFRFWVRGEFLAYWVKDTPLPISVVAGNPGQELLNSDQKFGALPGFRLGLGFWFDKDQTFGMEGNIFALAIRSRRFLASSDGNGNPDLSIQFNNQTPGAAGNNLMMIASPGIFSGYIQTASSIRFSGSEANGTFLLYQNPKGLEITALVGIRYVDLQEDLLINTYSTTIVGAPNAELFLSDRFTTSNQFFGGQIGGRVNWRGDRFSFDLTGKLAMGANRQHVCVQGTSWQTGGGNNGTFPGGFFAQPSNMGHFSANQFTVIPSLEIKTRYYLNSRLNLFGGYDFIYWANVVRPGNQIDNNINLSQSSVLGGGVLINPAFPLPLLNRSDFWAQGVQFGLEFRY